MIQENNIIKRYLPKEVKSIDVNSRTITGYAAIFNSETNLYGDFFEVIAPGAFSNCFDRCDTVCLYNHNENFVLGRRSAGTLVLSEDDKGLPYSCDLPNTREDTLELVQRKDITGCSFSFTIKKEMYEERADGSILRTILEIDKLYDVGPVVFPAYDGTSVISDTEKKSFESFREERKKLKEPHIVIDYSQYDQTLTLQKHTF